MLLVEHQQDNQPYFENCVTLSNQAISDGYVIKAILWFQGETDTGYSYSVNYKILFWASMRDLRASIGQPYLYVIYAVLGYPPTNPSEPYWMSIHNQQLDAIINHPSFRYFETWDIYRCNWVHYCPDEYYEIDMRFMSKLLPIVPAPII